MFCLSSGMNPRGAWSESSSTRSIESGKLYDKIKRATDGTAAAAKL